MNPARSLGPALIVGGTALSQVWRFIVAPLVGGALAALVDWLLIPRVEPEPTVALDPHTTGTGARRATSPTAPQRRRAGQDAAASLLTRCEGIGS